MLGVINLNLVSIGHTRVELDQSGADECRTCAILGLGEPNLINLGPMSNEFDQSWAMNRSGSALDV